MKFGNKWESESDLALPFTVLGSFMKKSMTCFKSRQALKAASSLFDLRIFHLNQRDFRHAYRSGGLDTTR